jgi:hypothetical protein
MRADLAQPRTRSRRIPRWWPAIPLSARKNRSRPPRFIALGLAVIFLLPIAANAADWTPAEITTLGWWDASDESSIEDTGGDVTQINDKSTNGEHLVTSTGNPTTGSRTQNDLNVLDHGGSTWMKATNMSFPASGNSAFFMVAEIDVLDNSNDSVYGLNNDTPTEFALDKPGVGNKGAALATLNAPAHLEANRGAASDPEASATGSFGFFSGRPYIIFQQKVW